MTNGSKMVFDHSLLHMNLTSHTLKALFGYSSIGPNPRVLKWIRM
jgi:hypothetical protein